MKTLTKIIISIVAGLAFAWVCSTPLNLDQTIMTVLTVVFTSGVFAACEKLLSKKTN